VFTATLHHRTSLRRAWDRNGRTLKYTTTLSWHLEYGGKCRQNDQRLMM
jgi:hypothetical protein